MPGADAVHHIISSCLISMTSYQLCDKGSVAADLGVCSRVELLASEPRVIWYIQQQKASCHDVPPTL
jgi:hypothetical protein